MKISRADLLQDIANGKWRRYVTEYGIPRVAFAVAGDAAATIATSDIPSDAGLWVLNKHGDWKRKKGCKSLEGDQRKLDPLMLLSLLSEPPYDALRDRRTRRWEALREAVPTDVMTLITERSNKQVAEELRYSIGSELGADLARRLATAKKEPVAVPAWAERIVALCAAIDGADPAEFRRELIANEERTTNRVESILKQIVATYERHDDLNRALRAAQTLLSGWFDGDSVASTLADVEERIEQRRTVKAKPKIASLRAARDKQRRDDNEVARAVICGFGSM